MPTIHVKTLLFILSFVALTPAFANVFGPDNRIVRKNLPWHLNSIGSIENCTAVLVARDIALTAAHCVIENGKTIAPSRVVFKAGLNFGRVYGTSAVSAIHRAESLPSETKVSADWALLMLTRPLGDKLGWMTLGGTDESTSLSELPAQVSLAGYSGDLSDGNVLSEHAGCRIRGKVSYLFLHDCDFTIGASGAPIFSLVPDKRTGQPKPTLWGLNLGSVRAGTGGNPYLEKYEPDYANGAIPLQDIAAKLDSLTQAKLPLTAKTAPQAALTSRE